MTRSYLEGKLTVEQVGLHRPSARGSTPGLFRVKDAGGEFGVPIRHEPFSHAEFVECLPGVVRGNHYHEASTEILYVGIGSVECQAVDIATGARARTLAGAGSLVRIGPGVGHAFKSLEHTIAVVLATGDLLDDFVPHHLI